MNTMLVTAVLINHKAQGVIKFATRRKDVTGESSLYLPMSLCSDSPIADADILNSLTKHCSAASHVFRSMGVNGKNVGKEDKFEEFIADAGRTDLPIHYIEMCFLSLISLILGFAVSIDEFSLNELQYIEDFVGKSKNIGATDKAKGEMLFSKYKLSRIPVEVILSLRKEDEMSVTVSEVARFNSIDCMSLILYRLGLREMQVREKSPKALYKLILSIGIPWWLELHKGINPSIDSCIDNGGKLDLKYLSGIQGLDSFSKFLDMFPNVASFGLSSMWDCIEPGNKGRTKNKFVFNSVENYRSKIYNGKPRIPGWPFIAYSDEINDHAKVDADLFDSDIYARFEKSIMNLAGGAKQTDKQKAEKFDDVF